MVSNVLLAKYNVTYLQQVWSIDRQDPPLRRSVGPVVLDFHSQHGQLRFRGRNEN